MSESVQDYAASYSFTKLEETARTFRRLGEAYENVTDIAPGQPGIAKQLLLVADVLDECVTMNLSSSDMDKDCSKELFKRCFMNGIRIKNVQHLSKDKGVNELALQARTVGKNCISVKKILPILTSVLGINYYIQGSSTMTINEEYK